MSAVPQTDGRFEVELQVPGGIGQGTRLSVSLVDGSGRTLALTSAPLGSPVAAESEVESSEPVGVSPPEKALPTQVARTRDAILDAARAWDWRALRELIPERGFTFSFGGERDPIAYWRELESVGHVPVLGDILPLVLSTDPGRFRSGYIWPAQAGEDPSEWDERDLAVLRQFHTEREIRMFQQYGIYLGWRVGIDQDGTWVFFVAGD